MRDNSGVSLSVSDPDNLNAPMASNGLADDAADYAQSYYSWGDSIATQLDVASDSMSPSVALRRGSAPALPSSSKKLPRYGLLILGGVVGLTLLTLIVLNSED